VILHILFQQQYVAKSGHCTFDIFSVYRTVVTCNVFLLPSTIYQTYSNDTCMYKIFCKI